MGEGIRSWDTEALVPAVGCGLARHDGRADGRAPGVVDGQLPWSVMGIRGKRDKTSAWRCVSSTCRTGPCSVASGAWIRDGDRRRARLRSEGDARGAPLVIGPEARDVVVHGDGGDCNSRSSLVGTLMRSCTHSSRLDRPTGSSSGPRTDICPTEAHVRCPPPTVRETIPETTPWCSKPFSSSSARMSVSFCLGAAFNGGNMALYGDREPRSSSAAGLDATEPSPPCALYPSFSSPSGRRACGSLSTLLLVGAPLLSPSPPLLLPSSLGPSALARRAGAVYHKNTVSP